MQRRNTEIQKYRNTEIQKYSFDKWRELRLVYALLLSLLSSGTFAMFLVIFFSYRRFVISSHISRFFYVLFFVAVFVALGGVIHKVLFFTDPVAFYHASTVSVEAFYQLDIDSIFTIIHNLLNRSLIATALDGSPLRVCLVFIYFFIGCVAFFVRRDKISCFLMGLFFIGIFTEGLTAYSFLVVILLLILDRIRFVFKVGQKLSG